MENGLQYPSMIWH